ncbi:hypothetical protein ACLKA6_000931 [Drosophila palustris]
MYDATQRINELNVRGSNENVATLKLHGNQRLDQDATSRKQIEHQSAHLPNENVATYRQQNDLIGSRPSNDNVATSQLHGFENVSTAQQQNGLLRHSHENVASTQQHSAYINSRMYHTNATTDKLYDNNNVATLRQQNGSNMPIKNVVTFQPPENVATFRQHHVHVHPQMLNEQMRNENYNHGNIPNRQYQEYYPPRFNDNSQWNCARHVSAYGHVKEMLALIPDFNPTSEKSLSPQQFIRRIGNLRNTYGWDDETLIFGVQQKMQGAARYWIDTVNDVVQTVKLKIFVGSIFGVRRVITESSVLRWIIKHLTKRSSCGSCGYCQRIHLPLWQYPTGHVRHLFVRAGRGAALGYWSLCSAHSTHSFLVDWIVAEN